MAALVLSLVITVLLLALPGMTWSVYKSRRTQPDALSGKTLYRILLGCTITAWAAQILFYLILYGAQGPIEVKTAAQLSAPLGWLVWLAALIGLAAFIIIKTKKRSPSKERPRKEL